MSKKYEVGRPTLAVDGWAVTFGTVSLPGPSLLYQMQLAVHPSGLSMPSVPITVLLYNGLLLCGFNISIKEGYIFVLI